MNLLIFNTKDQEEDMSASFEMMAAAKQMSVDSAEAAFLSGLDDTKNSLVRQHGSPQGSDTRLVSRPHAGRKGKKLILAHLLVAVA